MRIAEVVGNVTLNRCHPTFHGAKLRLAIPLLVEDFVRAEPPAAETLVVWDELGAGLGSHIALSEGPEAAQPFRPEIKPVDAYAAAILDRMDVDESLVKSLIRTE
jgi:ethanolamine utilization protein EutN